MDRDLKESRFEVSVQRPRINAPQVVGEVVDGEAVIVNLINGNYYSLDAVGSFVWLCIEKRALPSEIVEAVARHYTGSHSDIEPAISALLEQMEREGLVLFEDAGDNLGAAPLDGSDAAEPFSPPVLRRYDDMQDLLLLDPIHDVDEMGWPNVKTDDADDTDSDS